MDFCSSFAGFIEFIASPGEIVVDDNLFGEHPWLKLIIEPLFLYGSLPRPPELQSPVVLPSFLMDCSVLLELCWFILTTHKMFRASFVIQKKKITVKDSTKQGELTVIIVDWLFKRHLALLLHLPFAQVYDGVSLFYKEEDKPVAATLYGESKIAATLVTKADLALLLPGTGYFVGQENVDDSDRLCTFIFGSLTRPPEAHCVFRFMPLTFT